MMCKAVDWESALAGVNGDRSLLKLVIDAFLLESVELESRIAQSVADNDTVLLHRSGHTLKGAMMSLGATAWIEPVLQIEKLGAAGSMEGAQRLADQLAAQLPELRKQLRSFSP